MTTLEAEIKNTKIKTNWTAENDLFNQSIAARQQVPHPVAGDKAPDFILPNEIGEDVSLIELLNKGPVILSFFKGEWCNICDVELKALQRALPEFRKYGATLLGISPHTVSLSCMLKEKKQLSYTILSDSGNEIANKYGLRFPMLDSLVDVFKGFGLDDLTAFHGDQGEHTNSLPIPGTFVIDTQRTVTFSFVDSDHTKRAEPSEIVAALISIAN